MILSDNDVAYYGDFSGSPLEKITIVTPYDTACDWERVCFPPKHLDDTTIHFRAVVHEDIAVYKVDDRRSQDSLPPKNNSLSMHSSWSKIP